MSRFWTLQASISLSMALSLSAQTDVHQRLVAAAGLVLEGHYAESIQLARPALESEQLTDLERGRGWTLLGSAYEFQGEFQEAMAAYENALKILGRRDADAADYAAALRSFGTLFRDMGQFDAASRLETRALQIDQQNRDHAGIAIDCASLADLELGRKHTKRAQASLDKAIEESKLAPALGDDFHAFVTSSQAWLAELKGNARAAAAGFEKEIEYLARSHGEQSPQTGWAYLLLGKAFLADGNVNDALKNMLKGRAILRDTVGTDNPRYLAAQLAYSQALKSAGMRAAAAQTGTDAEQRLKQLYEEQCAQCRITAMALH